MYNCSIIILISSIFIISIVLIFTRLGVDCQTSPEAQECYINRDTGFGESKNNFRVYDGFAVKYTDRDTGTACYDYIASSILVRGSPQNQVLAIQCCPRICNDTIDFDSRGLWFLKLHRNNKFISEYKIGCLIVTISIVSCSTLFAIFCHHYSLCNNHVNIIIKPHNHEFTDSADKKIFWIKTKRSPITYHVASIIYCIICHLIVMIYMLDNLYMVIPIISCLNIYTYYIMREIMIIWTEVKHIKFVKYLSFAQNRDPGRDYYIELDDEEIRCSEKIGSRLYEDEKKYSVMISINDNFQITIENIPLDAARKIIIITSSSAQSLHTRIGI